MRYFINGHAIEGSDNAIALLEELITSRTNLMCDCENIRTAAAVVIEQHKQGGVTDAAIYDLEKASWEC